MTEIEFKSKYDLGIVLVTYRYLLQNNFTVLSRQWFSFNLDFTGTGIGNLIIFLADL
jgi:hypothetical protein